MQVMHVSNFKKDIENYLNQVSNYEDTLFVTTETDSVVIMSKAEYDGIKETAYIKSIPGLAESLIEAANEPESEWITRDWKNELRD